MASSRESEDLGRTDPDSTRMSTSMLRSDRRNCCCVHAPNSFLARRVSGVMAKFR